MMEKIVNGELYTEESIIERHQGIAHYYASKYEKMGSTLGMERQDLFSIGCMGIVKAFRRYDPSFRLKFSTFAVPTVKGEILRSMRDINVGPKYSRRVKELLHIIRKMDVEDRPVKEIIKATGATKDMVIAALHYGRNSIPVMFSHKLNSSEDEPLTMEDMIGCRDDETYDEVMDFIRSLDPKEQIVVEMLMEERSQREIGKVIGFSQMHVSRYLKRIKKKAAEYFELTEVV